MLVQISGRGFELNSELRDDIESKLTTALDRFGTRIGRVNVFLADVNGPKNGLDKSMRVVVDMERLPLIVVEERGELWSSTLDQATDRIVHSVSRQLERVRARSGRTNIAGDLDD